MKIGADNIISGMPGQTGYPRVDSQELSEGVVEFGRVVIPGTTAQQLKPMALVTDSPVGIALFDNYAQEVSEADQYGDGVSMSYRKQGTVKLKLGEAVEKHDLLSVSADGKTFFKKDNAGKANIPARALESGVLGDIIEVYVDFLTL
ncbi:hypothetical protein PM10SUCC1_32450 [Propionigenium maris DSM 9537]|uniref:Uncharacterized protein n=1 Tax=Propionigenium maris DSM 9537 TaxID=1123000 RepID=A0A9W6GPN0_9FUSO|nr:hypothetical protein [Propionigenium maris]GLI57731.1 hypothetical protein PM10SUCC1_32450 [Propionigenium maris DSM 9537]